MLFSSISFLYYFLPIILILYYLMPNNKAKNIVLLIGSLFFYFYGEPKFVGILILSCIVNFFVGKLIEKAKNEKNKKENKKNKLVNNLPKIYLVFGILFDLGLLVYFKYTNFIIQNLNAIFSLKFSVLNIVMPIGISFFTFQTLSYIIDVYTGKVKADNSIIDFSTYVALFPQLVAGPIVRYVTVKEDLTDRKHSFENFSNGVVRFIIGLGKKVLIANVIGNLVVNLNAIENKSVILYILEAVSFTLQIYFDFSGYSDMAIGLGRMFSFRFLENFNYPFISSSITEFWRRWHISLSSFLRDYVYIPLGGNRVSKIKFIRNIFVVWFLTGFWHGANWNFILWGLYFAVLLLIEKKFLLKFLEKHKIFSHIYTMFFVIISFVIFNNENLRDIGIFIRNMLFLNGDLPIINNETIYYLKSYGIILIIAIIGSTPLFKNIYLKLNEKSKIYNKISVVLEPVILMGLFIIITAFLVDASFNPFLYFRF